MWSSGNRRFTEAAHTGSALKGSKYMFYRAIALFVLTGCLVCAADNQSQTDFGPPPKAGPVALFPEKDLKAGMRGVAWTVFSGDKPEPVPVEIVGIWKSAWGPKQDIIVGKLSGKASRTNVAGGMSGSPVYIDGKLVGAIALRLSVFSPDAICGITPIQLMLDINSFDKSRPAEARTPDRIPQKRAALEMPGELLGKVVAAGADGFRQTPMMTPIATPVTFSGFSDAAIREFAPVFEQLGLTAVQGGAAGSVDSVKPAKDWQNALQPGESVAAVLVSGDMTMTGAGTVTYNDGKNVLAFGHPMFNLGPVDMPIAKEDIITTLASSYQPTKMGNSGEVVGALRQDRHSGILGELGATSDMIPVTLHVRSHNADDSVRKAQDFHFNVFVQQKWTPYLMMATLFNAVSNLNDFAENATYRLTGELNLDGHEKVQLSTMQAPAELPIPAPMVLAGWWGDKFNRLFLNPVTMPKLKSVNATIDLLPERRIAQIESAWIADNRVEAGSEVPVKVFLRPYRGERMEREVKVKIPAGLARGEHQILFSDADTLNKFQTIASSLNRFVDIPQTVAMLNQERSNDHLYVSLVESQPTVYSDEKVLPNLPASVLNVMQSGRDNSHQIVSAPQTTIDEASLPFNVVVDGHCFLKIYVK
jgi:hypothetical protein